MQNLLNSWGFPHQKENTHFHNLTPEELIDYSVKLGVGVLSSDGALTVNTGTHTGRAAQDKYVVDDAESSNKVWWNKDVRKMSPQDFAKIKEETLNYLKKSPYIFTSERSVGADETYHLGVKLITPCPSHALFAEYLFRKPSPSSHLGEFTVIHAPEFFIDSERFNTRSSTVITTNLTERTIIILGTSYAGEIKKSIFSVMNYLLPDEDILPMHSGANQGADGNVSVFFGLSGTGKTTLSTDEGKKLIGDDEHALSKHGIFNFEGGCYAKTHNLSVEHEPDIYKALTRKGALLENVVLNEVTKKVDFEDASLSENGRGSYPLEFIKDIIPSSNGPVPKDIFFLCADAFGVLPPVAKLNKAQAMYYFLSGYTAKVAGTEIGVKEPQATFSTCFGAPFMLRKPDIYGGLLGKFLETLNINVWLINTGWTNGPYGKGHRFPIKVTRSIIRAIQDGKVQNNSTTVDPIFGLAIPNEIEGVPTNLLHPWETWDSLENYENTAKKLAEMFHHNMEQIGEKNPTILAGQPHHQKLNEEGAKTIDKKWTTATNAY